MLYSVLYYSLVAMNPCTMVKSDCEALVWTNSSLNLKFSELMNGTKGLLLVSAAQKQESMTAIKSQEMDPHVNQGFAQCGDADDLLLPCDEQVCPHL